MKERVMYIFLLLLVSLVLFSGCFSKVKELDEISGPTWVTSLTMPLVTRKKATRFAWAMLPTPREKRAWV